MTLIFMFPGQSSRYPEMLDKLVSLTQANREIVEQASEILGRDLLRHYSADNPDAFARNEDIQIGVFLANHLFLTMLSARGIYADHSLGLSLGEYNHLVHIEALEFAQALRLIQLRGQAYDRGPHGWMACVQPMDLDELRNILVEVQDFGPVEIVNLNSPRQQVIAGKQAAVEAAIKLLEDEHFMQPIVIEHSVPMHSSLFEDVAIEFKEHLANTSFQTPIRSYLPNRLGRRIEVQLLTQDQSQGQNTFVKLLSEHVFHPVLWRRSIDHLMAEVSQPVFVEVGPLSVLYNLLDRRWCRAPKFRTDSRESTIEHFSQLGNSLQELDIQQRLGEPACMMR